MAELFTQPQAQPVDFDGDPSHGILLIHGFGGSPAQMRPMADALAGAGFTVKSIRLAGHAQTLEAMMASTWRDWLQCARDGFDRLSEKCEKVSVAGLSMGGDLTLILAGEKPVYRAISVCAPLRAKDWRAPFAGLLHRLMPYQDWSKDPPFPGVLQEYTISYPGVPTRKVADLQVLMRMAARALPRVTCPLMVVEAGHDGAIHPKSAQWIMHRAASGQKQHLLLPGSPHTATIGPECRLLFSQSIAFLQQ